MTTGKKSILALAVIALLIGAWFVAYHNHKSTSNLPQLSAIALMDEADVNELLVGYYRTQLPDVWGGPDPEYQIILIRVFQVISFLKRTIITM